MIILIYFGCLKSRKSGRTADKFLRAGKLDIPAAIDISGEIIHGFDLFSLPQILPYRNGPGVVGRGGLQPYNAILLQVKLFKRQKV